MSRFFVLLALPLAAFALNAEKVKFLIDFLDSQSKPTNLIVWKSCFDQKEKFEVLKMSFVPTLFTQEDSLNSSDFQVNPQHNLFVLDFTCMKIKESEIEKVKN